MQWNTMEWNEMQWNAVKFRRMHWNAIEYRRKDHYFVLFHIILAVATVFLERFLWYSQSAKNQDFGSIGSYTCSLFSTFMKRFRLFYKGKLLDGRSVLWHGRQKIRIAIQFHKTFIQWHQHTFDPVWYVRNLWPTCYGYKEKVEQ